MNQGRIWCVVHPTVGLPLFLGSVALTSLAVHTAVMTHTNWMGNYWQGSARTKVSENATPSVATAQANPAFSVIVTPVPATSPTAPASFVITLSPNSTTAAPVDVKAAEATTPPPGAVALR